MDDVNISTNEEKKKTVGFALCGSFCTFAKVIPQIKKLVDLGYNVIPIMSFNAYNMDTRFGKAEDFRKQIAEITGKEIIYTIDGAEPIGPKKLLDILIIAPCTGNTIAKISNGISDTPVTVSAKSQLRNNRPVLIALSTNDALFINAKNIGTLMSIRNIYFVPLQQDNPTEKPCSVVCDMDLIPIAVEKALLGEQIQPIL